MTEEKNLPVGKTRIGVISVTTWQKKIMVNDEEKTILNHVPEISYKDKKTDEWKTGKSYNTHDLPKLILCLQEQYKQAMLKE